MFPRSISSVLIAFSLTAVLFWGSATAVEFTGPQEARLLRFPDIHGDFVVFVYGGDLWRAPVAGGPAARLTSHEGLELFPKISPDGRWIAYTAEYTGSRQVYVMPAWGGEPKQLTFYTDVGLLPPRGGYDNWILGWTPSGKILVRMNRTPFGDRMGSYFLVDPKGGQEEPLPLPHGGSASFSEDGKKLAYCPVDREFRTWKRTRGGRAQDIWIFDLEAKRSERITDAPTEENFPMWKGDTIYFASDRDGKVNLYAYDVKKRDLRQLTRFTEYDVLWPSLGPEAIVFMDGGYLYRFDLASEKAERLAITMGAEQRLMVPRFKDVRANIENFDLSPGGQRGVFEARGELFTVPAKDGPTRNLTQTQGIREHSPAWSGDGKWIAYLSDETGEYEIYLRPQDGSGTPRRLTTTGGPWIYPPVWNPDSTKLVFADRAQRLRIVDVAAGTITEVDRGTQQDLNGVSWSPDGKWLVYQKNHPSRLAGIALYSLDQNKVFQLGDGLTQDFQPVWSADGKYLFFQSNRDFNLTFSAFEFDYLYTRATRIFVAALDPSAPALFPLKSDEETPKPSEGEPKEKEDEKKAGKEEKPEAAKPALLPLDPAGFLARTVALPGLPAGNYGAMAAASDALYYQRTDAAGAAALYRFDFKERKEDKVQDGVTAFVLSPSGKKLMYRAGQDFGIADARAGLKPGEGKLDLTGLVVKLDPHAEMRQMFDDGWRIFRDWFYDPAMHGVDWKAMKERYGQLVPFVAHRSDLDFILGEMAGELESGHTYINAGDEPRVTRVEGGMLGCRFEASSNGFFRIARIFSGENWDEAYRSPLTEPGIDVKAGDFLLAIDGTPLTTADNPYRLLENKANRQVTLTVNSEPRMEGSRQVSVRTLSSEQDLMYIDWVKSRMELVNRLSGGRIGYIHLPDTAGDGNRMLQKLFFGQATKPALIIDDRYNGGGFIPVRMIEYLARRTQAFWARRGIDAMRSPGFAHDGPKAMLINGYASSGGDALPYWFRKNGLGPLIGTRTWGGLIGISGNPSLIDGAALNVPTFRIFDDQGRWVIENEGVSPDIEVIDLPEALLKGGDPSIEKAVEVLLKKLEGRGSFPPSPPPAPDMTK